MIKKRFLVILILLCSLSTGCTHDMNREEIDEIDLVLVLGIDYRQGEYELSALYNTGGGANSGSGSGTGKEEIAKGKGKSAYEALVDLKRKNKKDITLAQAGAFLIGEEAAKHGIDNSLDFLKRDETIKMEALVYTVKEEAASKFIETGMKNKQTIHEDLKAVQQKQLKLLTRIDNTLVNIFNDMEQSYSSVLIPYLIAEKSSFLIEGYAVFTDQKLTDYLDRETSDGVNFIKNIMRSYPIYLPEGVSMEISYTKTKLKVKMDQQNITVLIRLSYETMFKEITTKTDPFQEQELLRLTEEQNAYIRSILEKPVNYSIAHGIDILNLARQVENQNTKEWITLESNWKEAIPKINYIYDVRSQITKSFLLGNEE